MRCKKGELGGGCAWSGWGRNGTSRKGGDSGHSDPFEMSAAARAIGERGAWGVVWRRGRGGWYGAAQRATGSCARVAEAAMIGQRVDRGGRQLTCSPWPQYRVAVKFDSKSKFKRIQIRSNFDCSEKKDLT
jgi:hypothetical protein